ncbi:Aste57867_18591 [Aphanomyces stellatus]|uniref:Aste57867_18591 protein n=1 Tax=Aphanomyces stellatus TaxID=120398 RepID=A0A485LBD1_9STRA|nr:hypothetical protein As57867_018529 [Aphanomyces stellatus]VFT95326.1 Aste57867_18591 [Aphanomyces stellatus]
MADSVVDMVVVGGGVVGAAVFRELVLRGYSVVLLEKNAEFVHGASCGNSGIACTGFDAPVDSLERRCIRRAMEMNPRVYRELGLPSSPVGSLVVAWTHDEVAALPHTLAANHAIGDLDARLLSQDELYAMEPHLAPGALGAVFVPGEVMIEPWLIPIAYLHHGLANGGTVRLQHEVVRGAFDSQHWTLHCTNGTSIRARCVLNCAGLYGDLVECIHASSPSFHIRPRKGQYVVFETSTPLVRRVVQPVPSDRTKGVFVFTNLYGHTVVGPTAEDQDARDVAEITPAVQAMLRRAAVAVVPGLATAAVIGAYAGLRPATQHRDYQILVDAPRAWVTVAGIRSTGVTASLGIAAYVADAVTTQLPHVTPKAKAVVAPFRLPPLASLATERGVVVLGAHEHVVTHPLSRWGLAKLAKPTTPPRL